MGEYVLASQSPRRKLLLEWAEIDFEVMPAFTEETFPPNLSHGDIAIHIASEKAAAIRSQTDKTIIAADTMVVLEGEIMGKPADEADAISMLSRLSGKIHSVITGVVISKPDSEVRFFDETKVTFHQLTPNQIRHYVQTYKPYDKAGAYAIQEWMGVIGIKSVEGDFYNVMGLPVSRVVQALSA